MAVCHQNCTLVSLDDVTKVVVEKRFFSHIEQHRFHSYEKDKIIVINMHVDFDGANDKIPPVVIICK